MAKTAKDFPNVTQAFGINMDDDTQIDAFDHVLTYSAYRADAEVAERLLRNGRDKANLVALRNLRAPVAAALSARGVRPEEVRRG